MRLGAVPVRTVLADWSQGLGRLLADPDRAEAKRVMEAMLSMKRLDVAALERAARA